MGCQSLPGACGAKVGDLGRGGTKRRESLCRRGRRADGRAQRLERLEDQDPAQEALQEKERQPAPRQRHLAAAQLALVNAVLDEPAEQAAQPAGREAGRLSGACPGRKTSPPEKATPPPESH